MSTKLQEKFLDLGYEIRIRPGKGSYVTNKKYYLKIINLDSHFDHYGVTGDDIDEMMARLNNEFRSGFK